MRSIPKAEPKDKADKADKVDKPRNPSPRVIRTFEEVKVQTVVNEEEWYEELECGICAHILGGTQALVPCGHSFCGPCVWQWIRINKQTSCPHCRVQVSDTTPFVPNIMIDQIIDRKLPALPESPEKRAMETERHEKIEAWKMIQASIAPAKPIQKRPRGLDEIISSVLELGASGNDWQRGHARRASRNLMELGAPINHPVQAAIPPRPPLPHYDTITDLARMRDERIQEQLIDLRRVREQRIRQLDEPPRSGPSNQQTPRTQIPLEQQGRQARQSSASNLVRAQASARDGSIRSAALARRQARGQNFDDPLVLSDED